LNTANQLGNYDPHAETNTRPLMILQDQGKQASEGRASLCSRPGVLGHLVGVNDGHDGTGPAGFRRSGRSVEVVKQPARRSREWYHSWRFGRRVRPL